MSCGVLYTTFEGWNTWNVGGRGIVEYVLRANQQFLRMRLRWSGGRCTFYAEEEEEETFAFRHHTKGPKEYCRLPDMTMQVRSASGGSPYR